MSYRATINGRTYDTSEAEAITDYPSPDGEDALYRSAEAGFFLVSTVTYLDGRRLKPDKSVDELAPELYSGALHEMRAERFRRLKVKRAIIPLTDRDALIWCVKAHIPECFRGCILDSI